MKKPVKVKGKPESEKQNGDNMQKGEDARKTSSLGVGRGPAGAQKNWKRGGGGGGSVKRFRKGSEVAIRGVDSIE